MKVKTLQHIGFALSTGTLAVLVFTIPEGKFVSAPKAINPTTEVGMYVNPLYHIPGKSECIVRAGQKVADYGDTLVNTMGCEVAK